MGTRFILVRAERPNIQSSTVGISTPLMINARSRSYKRVRVGGKAPKPLVVEVVELRATEWSPKSWLGGGTPVSRSSSMHPSRVRWSAVFASRVRLLFVCVPLRLGANLFLL
jgi:hypothetical protein